MKTRIHARVTSMTDGARISPGDGPTTNELRLALTLKCNFNCFFCHHEGQGPLCRASADYRQVLELIKAEVIRGCDDVTLTGGEPLLERELLSDVVSGLARFPAASRPALTIVSNGSRWDAELIRLLAAYPARRKVNISLHASDPGTYDRVTGSHGQRNRVIATVRELVAAGVDVKLNAVVLRGVNSSREDFEGLISLARALRVGSVKFMELLCQPGDVQAEALFVGCEEIEGRLAELGYNRTAEISRGAVLAHPSKPGFTVEVKRCSCALGCGPCRDALGRNFGPDLKPHGCFWSDGTNPRAAACGHETGSRKVA